MTPRGVPRPPRELEREMESAGRDGDDYRLAVARAKYAAWLADEHGIHEGAHGSEAPDEAVR